MTVIRGGDGELARGLEAIRGEFDVPADFPPEVLAAADEAVGRAPAAHVDRTDLPFVTLDPPLSRDLDQAFCIERRGDDVLLRYAIADVGWFVDPGGTLAAEAWRRGTTLYLPDERAPLYPPALSEGAASLLPDGPRPAVVFAVVIDTGGGARLEGAERAVIRSRSKLATTTVQTGDLPEHFAELARRVHAAEAARGAVRVDPPEQEVHATGDGRYELTFRARRPVEDDNAAMSLATNMAVAEALQTAGTGLFRVMDEPDEQAVSRLRHTAHALGIPWPQDESLDDVERRLDPADHRHAAMMVAVRRAGGGARYVPYRSGVVPRHAAVAATYAHATAPLRRLADRYVVDAALAVTNGRPVPDDVARAFGELPAVMSRADQRGAQIDRAVIELAETAVLHGQEGATFAATVTDLDQRGARVQLAELPVVTRVDARGVEPGDDVRVKLVAVDIAARRATFTRVA